MGSQSSAAFPDDVRAALDAFRKIIQTLRSSARDTERRVGISTAQLFALQQLAHAPGASVNELAARTFTHQSSVSVVVQRLVKQRLVAKVTSNDDRRRVRLGLTDAGRLVLRKSPEPVQERLIAGMAALSDHQRHVFAAALKAIADTITGAGAPPPMLFEERIGRRNGRARGRSTRENGRARPERRRPKPTRSR